MKQRLFAGEVPDLPPTICSIAVVRHALGRKDEAWRDFAEAIAPGFVHGTRWRWPGAGDGGSVETPWKAPRAFALY